jgi:DNA-binding NarL/FixJ family response regulator
MPGPYAPGRRVRALLPEAFASAQIDIVGAARAIGEASDLARETGVDVVLLDHRGAAGRGSAALRQFLGAHHACAAVVVMEDHRTIVMDEIAHTHRTGWVTKDATFANLAETTWSIVSGVRENAALAELSAS